MRSMKSSFSSFGYYVKETTATIKTIVTNFFTVGATRRAMEYHLEVAILGFPRDPRSLD